MGWSCRQVNQHWILSYQGAWASGLGGPLSTKCEFLNQLLVLESSTSQAYEDSIAVVWSHLCASYSSSYAYNQPRGYFGPSIRTSVTWLPGFCYWNRARLTTKTFSEVFLFNGQECWVSGWYRCHRTYLWSALRPSSYSIHCLFPCHHGLSTHLSPCDAKLQKRSLIVSFKEIK